MENKTDGVPEPARDSAWIVSLCFLAMLVILAVAYVVHEYFKHMRP